MMGKTVTTKWKLRGTERPGSHQDEETEREVSEPTRLSVLLEARSGALNQNNASLIRASFPIIAFALRRNPYTARMPITRRRFVTRTSLGLAGGAALSTVSAADSNPSTERGERPLIVSTWGFGKPANDQALKILLGGGTILDALEQGIRVTESDKGNSSVGLGGMPNAAGVVQLDACIMSGPGHRAGSVAAIEGIVHPISAARRVMEKTPHVMLAG
jgi:hypothetical protein